VSGAATPVVCLVEHDEDGPVEASRRALTMARDLAGSSGSPLDAVLVGTPTNATSASLSSFGVRRAYLLAGEGLEPYAARAWGRALLELQRASGAHALVAAGSDRGNEVMAHAGALADLPMVANCLSATRVDESTVALSRQRWAGSLIEDSVLDSPVALLTVAFDGVSAQPAASASDLATEEFAVTPGEDDLDVTVAQWTKRAGGISLADARVVVGGGRGVGSAESFSSLDELAELLGAAVGVSRAVTSLGWRSHSQQVGQTGTRISPDLYVVCGISGATQHLAGCQSAKVVLAINTDADAPIITRADYAVIGDLNAVVPALVTALRAR
jgi:electron transfer flavoprotein alpha subunit